MTKDLWTILEERTRAWDALARQGLADAIWADFVSVRFGRTGDPRALQYLYPYLNHADRGVRLRALDVAAHVLEGRGPRVIPELSYFTANPDPFLRDRAVQVVAAAVTGSRDQVVLEALAPYLNHPNQFIRKLALAGLGKATEGQGSPLVLTEIRRVAGSPGPRQDEVDLALARAFSGCPTEEVYRLVAQPERALALDSGNVEAVSTLVLGAPDEWHERACREVFEPALHVPDGPDRWTGPFVRRAALEAVCHASAGRGMEALQRLLHLRHERCTLHALLGAAPQCFAGADPQENRGPLVELARRGDLAAQRVAAVCLGRLVMGAEDEEAVTLLRELCGARSPAVQASALTGVGMAARSSGRDELRQTALDHAGRSGTSAPAIRSLGMVFLGSGRPGVFGDLRGLTELYRAHPVRGKRHSRPLAACYWATGLLYLGTGSTEPLEFLLDVLAPPRVPCKDEYRWAAAKALVMIEFPETALRGARTEVPLPV